MTRLTSNDRDGAVKILSILTGGVTATALAATGVTMALAQQETSDTVATVSSNSSHSDKAKAGNESEGKQTTHTFSTAKGTSDDDTKKAADAKKRALNERCKVAATKLRAAEASDDDSFTYRAKAHNWSNDKIKSELTLRHRQHRLTCAAPTSTSTAPTSTSTSTTPTSTSTSTPPTSTSTPPTSTSTTRPPTSTTTPPISTTTKPPTTTTTTPTTATTVHTNPS
jgi:hypothetical protein